ncbi:hypothetical protein SPSIL_046130 [Sporomusa silvacetica DSM 10669]|uniref:Uncharacterized protein n=1 Tax=Sporomusa silvacetica DSM 10669 TaxID=1123289 RepID=A0ABZ3IRX3_9FIRM|nr:hypothetical protein SPSIL_42220 [Sporomusa silvacetica DSM 10669]
MKDVSAHTVGTERYDVTLLVLTYRGIQMHKRQPHDK